MKLLLDQVTAYVRSQFTSQEVASVQLYGGEFGAGEVDRVSYTCPAIFITILGWEASPSSSRMSGPHARQARLAAFVATKQPKRDARMLQAMMLADKLAVALRLWRPEEGLTDDAPLEMAPLSEEPRCENLYSESIDRLGQALWLVDWSQGVQPRLPLNELVDWLSLDITNLTRVTEAAEPAPAPLPAHLVNKPVVQDEITFPTT